jgi:hypothetical protein
MTMGGEPYFTSLLTVMNDIGFIVCMKWSFTKSLDEVATDLADLAKHLPSLQYCFTDDVKGQAGQLERLLGPALTRGVVKRATGDCKLLRLQDVEHSLVVSQVEGDSSGNQLLQTDASLLKAEIDEVKTQSADGCVVVSMDAEWSFTTPSVDVVQFCFRKNDQHRVWLFHVAKATKLTPALKELLSDPKVTFVGKLVDSDMCRLRKRFELQGKDTDGWEQLWQSARGRCKDLAHIAKAKGVVKSAHAGLDQLLRSTCSLALNKSDDVRVVNWRSLKLEAVSSRASKEYAALDVIAGLLIWEKLQSLGGVSVGSTVQLHSAAVTPSSQTAIVAEDLVQASRPRSSRQPAYLDVKVAVVLDTSFPLPSSEGSQELQEGSVVRWPESNVTVKQLENKSMQQQEQIEDDGMEEEEVLLTRVIKDIFHFLKKPYVKRSNGLYWDFYQQLREAVFVSNASDWRKAVEVWLAGHPDSKLTKEQVRWETAPAFFAPRVRRAVKSPEHIVRALQVVQFLPSFVY